MPLWKYQHAAEEYTALDDARIDLSAYYQSMEDLAQYLTVIGWTTEDVRSFLHAAVLSYSDMPATFSAMGDALENLITELQAIAWEKHDIGTYLAAQSALVLIDLGVSLEATNGLVLRNMGAWLCAIQQPPSFKASVAQRATSVIHSATWTSLADAHSSLQASASVRESIGAALQAIAA